MACIQAENEGHDKEPGSQQGGTGDPPPPTTQAGAHSAMRQAASKVFFSPAFTSLRIFLTSLSFASGLAIGDKTTVDSSSSSSMDASTSFLPILPHPLAAEITGDPATARDLQAAHARQVASPHKSRRA